MLNQLYIKNFTLISELKISFQPGFSVITGETGAGKSIVLGAIGLLLGNRADTKQIKSGTKKCVVEACFDLSGFELNSFFEENDIEPDLSETIIRREINDTGKSRAFINDTPVPLVCLKELGEYIIDIHSQHQNLLVGKEDFQLHIVDTIAATKDDMARYATLFTAYKDTCKKLDKLKEQIEKSKENEDFLRFQFQELSDADLQPGELEETEQEAKILEHAEDIKTALYQAGQLLAEDDQSAVDSIAQAIGALNNISNVDASINELVDRLESCRIEVKDIAEEISDRMAQIDVDPHLLNSMQERLDKLFSLQKKYKRDSVEELIALRDDMAEQLSRIENGDEELDELKQQLVHLEQQCTAAAALLTRKRKKSAKTIEQKMVEKLIPLGMPHIRFTVEIKPQPLTENGADKVSFLFSANTGTPLQPISHIASGGEIARVMLALKALLGQAGNLPTIIFDEIDTGVSGKVAEKMALIMDEMASQHRQVISITHLPQIAAVGKNHYKVTKEETAEGTESTMLQLTPEERIKEIAQMLSGSYITEAAIDNAKSLLKL